MAERKRINLDPEQIRHAQTYLNVGPEHARRILRKAEVQRLIEGLKVEDDLKQILYELTMGL